MEKETIYNQEYVVIIDRSAGNDSVGEMWQETKIFNGKQTIDDVMEWAMQDVGEIGHSRRRITITKPHQRDKN